MRLRGGHVPRPHWQGTGPLDHALEDRTERLRHRLRRPPLRSPSVTSTPSYTARLAYPLVGDPVPCPPERLFHAGSVWVRLSAGAFGHHSREPACGRWEGHSWFLTSRPATCPWSSSRTSNESWPTVWTASLRRLMNVASAGWERLSHVPPGFGSLCCSELGSPGDLRPASGCRAMLGAWAHLAWWPPPGACCRVVCAVRTRRTRHGSSRHPEADAAAFCLAGRRRPAGASRWTTTVV